MYPLNSEDGKLNQESLQAQKQLQTEFAKPGGPGAKFKNQQEKLLKTLSLPKGAKEELGITGEDGAGLGAEDNGEEEKDEESEELDAKKKEERELKK